MLDAEQQQRGTRGVVEGWWQSLRADVWLWGNRQVQGGTGGGQLHGLRGR